jgi:hypothetical protein
MSISAVFSGTAVTTTCTFAIPPAGTITDPDSVVLKYRAGNAAVVTWTYLGAGSIVRLEEGVYSAELDTTALAGTWTIEWIGTGGCSAVAAVTLQVTTPPL